MGNVNASDRIINIFSNNVIVYKQSTSLGQGPWWRDAMENTEGLTHPVTYFMSKLAALIFYSKD